MEAFLLSCQGMEPYIPRILPLLPPKRQEVFLRTHSLLSLGAGLMLAAKLGVHADEDLQFGPQGKPFLSRGAPFFSLSHSNGHVLLAHSLSPIGADMEYRLRPYSPALVHRVCLLQERDVDFLTVFTRKEAAMKLTGLGFSLPFSRIDTTDDFIWESRSYRFFTQEHRDLICSILSAEPSPWGIQPVEVTQLLYEAEQ